MESTQLDDALQQLDEAIEAFKSSPSSATLDDVYRATTAIEGACSGSLKQ